MKKNNTLKILLITILFTFLLTWLLPITYYSGGLYTDVRYPAGIFDVFSYPTLTFYYFGTTSLYVLLVGAFYAIFNKTGAYKKVCDKIVKLFKGKELIFFGVIIVILTAIVAFCGFSYELFFLLPLLASIILSMKYDSLTVAMTFVGSIAIGFIGNLYSANIVGTYISNLGYEYNDLIIFKIIILVLGMALLLLNIFLYTRKIDKKKDNSCEDLLPEKIEVKNKKGKVKPIWPAIVIFDLILVLMIIGSINFVDAFDVNIFATFHENVMNFTIKDYNIFSKILGFSLQDSSFGNWTSAEFMVIIAIATILLAIIYRVKLSDLFDGYKEGAKKFGLSALLMMLVYTVLIAIQNHPVLLTILKPLLSITDGFNSVTLSLSMFLTNIFNIDTYYIVSTIMPYVMSIITDTGLYPLIGFISQTMQGLCLLIAPTSVVLLGVIAYLKIDYTKWFKNIWKLFIELFILAFVIFTIILII